MIPRHTIPGTWFKAKMCGDEDFTYGRIAYRAGIYFLCQDSHSGAYTPEKFDFNFTYTVGNGSRTDFLRNNVTDFSLLKGRPEHLIEE